MFQKDPKLCMNTNLYLVRLLLSSFVFFFNYTKLIRVLLPFREFRTELMYLPLRLRSSHTASDCISIMHDALAGDLFS